MILGPEITLFSYLTLAALFRLVLGFSVRSALCILIIANIFLLSVLSIISLLYLTGQITLIIGLYAVCKKFPERSNRISWIAFVGLVPFNLRLWFGSSEVVSPFWIELSSGIQSDVVWVVGSTFFVVKSFVCLRECLREDRLQLLQILAGLSFLPSFAAGPIYGLGPFKPENISSTLDVRQLGQAIMQLGWGLAAFYVIAPALREIASNDGGDLFMSIFGIYANFAALFFDFSGYTLTAISVAAFFGVTLPPNFDKPYLATSIREFWQRWHMSLGWFIGTYLFKPFVRATGSPQKGIFLAFILVGLWHEITLGYLLWGIGHGYALSLAMKPPNWWRSTMSGLPNRRVKLISWALTMTWVALLSHLATNALEGP